MLELLNAAPPALLLGPVIALLALCVALAAYIRQGRRWAKEDARKPSDQLRLVTGPRPFSPTWRQSVLDWKVFDEPRPLRLVSVEAVNPRGLKLALGYPSGDTNKGPLLATSGTEVEVDRPFRKSVAEGHTPAPQQLSFDLFFQAPGPQQGAGKTITVAVKWLAGEKAWRPKRKLARLQIPPI